MEMMSSSLDFAVWIKDIEQYYFLKPVSHFGFTTTNLIFSVSHCKKLLLDGRSSLTKCPIQGIKES